MLFFGVNVKYVLLLLWKWLFRSKIFCFIDIKVMVVWFMMKRFVVWCIIDVSLMWYGRFVVVIGCFVMFVGSFGLIDVILIDFWIFWVVFFILNIIFGFLVEKEL